MDSQKQILCLTPDQTMVRTKKAANDQKIIIFFGLFCQKTA
jgi:hypothetical protein